MDGPFFAKQLVTTLTNMQCQIHHLGFLTSLKCFFPSYEKADVLKQLQL